MHLGGNAKVMYAPGYQIPEKKQDSDVNWQQDSINAEALAALPVPVSEYDMTGTEEGKALLKQAIALAKECEEVIFVGGLNHEYDVEGNDRASMKLPYGQDKVIEALLKVKPDMTVVMIAGAPVEMPWRNQAKAIVWAYYAGMETGNALADILFGKVNPSGKLAETFPVAYADTPTAKSGEFAKPGRIELKEGVFVGYRYYESQEAEVAYCFGHGLSYTEFSLGSFEIEEAENNSINVSLTVTNAGQRAGAEVVQVYTGPAVPGKLHPVKELKGFEKVYLEAGESKRVAIELSKEDFAHYDCEKKAFVTEPGSYRIMVGTSVRDICLEHTVLL